MEMISSSPSPTLHSTSSHHASPVHFARPRPSPSLSSASASSRTAQQSTSQSKPTPHFKPPSGPLRSTKDAGTQWSSPDEASGTPSSSRTKRKERPISTEHAPSEPTIQPLAPGQRAEEIRSTTQLNTVSSSSSSMDGSSDSSSSKRQRSDAQAKRIMPKRYELCDVKDLVQLIAAMLMELIRFNDEIPLQDGRLTRFHSRAPPGISVADYLQRLTTHATLSPPILLSMVYYIDRLCVLYPQFTISSLTVHRYLIASATVASKGLSDSFWTNNTYARVGGVSLKELALLELEFLWRLEWRIVPKAEVLVDYYRNLVERNDEFKMEDDDDDNDDQESEES